MLGFYFFNRIGDLQNQRLLGKFHGCFESESCFFG